MTPQASAALAVAPTSVAGVEIDYEGVLKALKLNPRDPNVQALVLVGQQYGLDPVLGHLILVDGKTYITHKGLLHVAHRERLADGRPALDGIETVEVSETASEWTAKVSVYRKDMGHAFTQIGRYSKSDRNKKYGPEMAVTRAECLALRRAFDVSLSVQEEQDFAPPPAGSIETTTRPALTAAPTVADPPAVSDVEMADEEDMKACADVYERLTDPRKTAFREWLAEEKYPPPKLQTKAQALECFDFLRALERADKDEADVQARVGVTDGPVAEAPGGGKPKRGQKAEALGLASDEEHQADLLAAGVNPDDDGREF